MDHGIDDLDGGLDDVFGRGLGTAKAWVESARNKLQAGRDALEKKKRAFEESIAQQREEFFAELRTEKDEIEWLRWKSREQLEEQVRQARAGGQQHSPPPESEQQGNIETERARRHQFNLERARYRREVEAYRREQMWIADVNAAMKSVTEFNVAGSLFASASSTLAQQPGARLERWVSGREHLSLDAAGRYFLDRDPMLFRTTLNFLRNNEVPPCVSSNQESLALCQEADYFGVHFLPFPTVYACGGRDKGGHLSSVELLDVENQRWRASQDMLQDRAYFAAQAFQSRLHVFGGQNAQWSAMGETEILDCLRGEWFPGSNLCVPRRNCAGAQDGQRIYAIGGYDGEQLLDSVEAHDPRMRGWELLPAPMTTPRVSAQAAMLNGRLVVLGGASGERRLKTMEAFEPRAGRWQRVLADLNDARSAGQAATCDNKLFIIGGMGDQHNIKRSIERYGVRADGAAWTFLRNMSTARMDFGCTMFGEMILVGGGQQFSVLSSTEFYKPSLDDWQPGPPLLRARYAHQLLAMNL